MRLRQRRSPLFILLLPALFALASSAAVEKPADKSAAKVPTASDVPGQASLESAANPTKSKVELGTKDAPVDGKDGKPHSGPWVDTTPKKGETTTETTETKKNLPQLKDKPADITVHEGKPIPQSNDGVMDDPHRQVPKEGTTGTQGGVSEKDKARKAKEGETGEKAEKIPETPKEKPPLPHSEQEKIAEKEPKKEKEKEKTKTDTKIKTSDEVTGLEKPIDLPDTKLDKIPVPSSADKDHLDVSSKSSSSKTTSYSTKDGGVENTGDSFHSFLLSLTMILFAEVGDKTFLVAALMAMKHDRIVVFTAAFGALFVMTVLSAFLGRTVPALIPKNVTAFLAAGLFFAFGVRMMREGLAMSPDEGVAAEMQEVEMDIQEKEREALKQGRRRSSVTPYAMEMGLGRKSRSQSRFPTPPRSPSTSPGRSPSPHAGVGGMVKNLTNGFSNLCSLLLSPAWVQTFVMTFLGEWGDRSQIATIAMSAGEDWWSVTLGALIGHCCCTGVAVIGGRAIAGRVSMRVVTLGGAIVFLLFGCIYLWEAIFFP